MSASAAGVSSLPVGASTPGSTPRQIGHHKKDEQCAEQRQKRSCVLADDVLDLPTMPVDDDSSTAWRRIRMHPQAPRRQPATRLSERAMMTQVVTTGRVIATGPR